MTTLNTAIEQGKKLLEEVPEAPPVFRGCAHPNCDRRHCAKGYCNTHYLQFKRTGKTQDIASRYTGDGCKEPGCRNSHKAKGLCGKHYNRALKETFGPCTVPGCEEISFTKSGAKCSVHWYQESKGLEILPRKNAKCRFEGCPKLALTKGSYRGWCNGHKVQLKQGRELKSLNHRERSGGTWRVNNQGYAVTKIPRTDKVVLQHRLVMEQHLQRTLLPWENVHHINGDRLDIRIENLELWSKAQPPGQRVEDKTQWAIEWLQTYKPEVLKEEVNE